MVVAVCMSKSELAALAVNPLSFPGSAVCGGVTDIPVWDDVFDARTCWGWLAHFLCAVSKAIKMGARFGVLQR